jgi:hypothetical protein
LNKAVGEVATVGGPVKLHPPGSFPRRFVFRLCAGFVGDFLADLNSAA